MLTYELLASFSKKELTNFEHLLHCDFFNTDESIQRLFTTLKNRIGKGLEVSDEDIPKIYQETFDVTKAINQLDKGQRKVLMAKMSLLNKLTKDFLVINALPKHEDVHRKILYQELLQKQQIKNYKRQLTKDVKTVQSNTVFSAKFQEFALEIQRAIYHLDIHNGTIYKKNNIGDLFHQLNIRYLVDMIEIHTTSVSLKMNLSEDNAPYPSAVFETITQLLEYQPYQNQLLVKTNYLILELIDKKEKLQFDQLIAHIKTYEKQLSKKDLQDAYRALINYAIKKIRATDNTYRDYIFELYQEMDTKDLLTNENGLMTMSRLKNIVGVSRQIDKLDWAEDMIEKYKSKLVHPNKEDVSDFFKGVLAQYRGKHKQAFSFLYGLKINPGYDISSRILAAKALYLSDTSYKETSHTYFRTTEQYIKQNKFKSFSIKQSYLNFIRILINLYKFRFNAPLLKKERADKKRAGIIAKLEKMKQNSDMNWLLDELNKI